jgi:flagellar hook-length control protein FliK
VTAQQAAQYYARQVSAAIRTVRSATTIPAAARAVALAAVEPHELTYRAAAARGDWQSALAAAKAGLVAVQGVVARLSAMAEEARDGTPLALARREAASARRVIDRLVEDARRTVDTARSVARTAASAASDVATSVPRAIAWGAGATIAASVAALGLLIVIATRR